MTAEDRAIQALRDYAEDPTEDRRLAFADAYAALPDLDQKYFLYHRDRRVSWLLWAVLTLNVGDTMKLEPVGKLFEHEHHVVVDRAITPRDHADALSVVREALSSIPAA